MKPRTHRPSRRPHRLTLSILSLTLLGTLSMPAFAADPVCVDTNGNPIAPAPSTDQGNEHGTDNATCDPMASAYGQHNNASGTRSNAFGNNNVAWNTDANAFGTSNQARGQGSSAFGYVNTAEAAFASAFGAANTATSTWTSAFGFNNNAGGPNHKQSASAFGANNMASGEASTAFGYGNTASALGSSAFGYINRATGNWSTAIGAGSVANAERSTAIGFQTVANESDVVSFGHAAGDLDVFGNAYGSDYNARLIHVADGINDTDAVNMRQLNAAIAGIPVIDLSPFAAAFGGGAAWGGGVFTAPSYTIQGVAYNNVGAALAAIDGWMTANAGGVQYDDPSHGTVTLDGAGGTQIKNVADGTDAMDAVNLGQMQAGEAATLTAANTYTDTKSAQTLASANAYTDQRFAAWNDTFSQYQQQVDRRFAQTDTRIDRIGAMGTAMTQMAVNAAMSNSPRGRIAIGVGSQGGQGAVSIGYGLRIGDRGPFSLGASFAHGESSVGGGFGIDL